MSSPTRLEAWSLDGAGEVTEGTDLAALLCGLVGPVGPVGPVGMGDGLLDGDVVLVTSKVVSKAEGRVHEGDRESAVREQTVRVVARRGLTSIVENHLGLVMAAAGVDASNVAPGHVALLPRDPDGSARALREQVRARRGTNVAVIVTDTAGRAWRTGQTDIAVGVAGLAPVEEFAGRTDPYGNPLAVTAPAVADELAGVAELVTGKLGRRPVSVVRGLAERVLAPGEHGPGARALLRPRREDLFALGAREAVLAAVRGDSADCFGSPAPAAEVLAALSSSGLDATVVGASVRVRLPEDDVRGAVVTAERMRLLAHAHGWWPRTDVEGGDTLSMSPAPPARAD